MKSAIEKQVEALFDEIAKQAKEDVKKLKKFLSEAGLEQARRLEPLRKKHEQIEKRREEIEQDSSWQNDANDELPISKEYNRLENNAYSLEADLDYLESEIEDAYGSVVENLEHIADRENLETQTEYEKD